ncbi:protein FAR1-RELATED SEQUENCE 2-like [Olea europaea var. sylvestris]|uniref:protein FAR1-RELATED SEQUENCE 2-like n=1 Tax=Olea europaea var. sylvestris TaxID=158386 RepID=UPI000C1D7EA7|nr:protein FAR1-RELATED SEQUENCE 2-like [Olea europaea var. sylvestris]
MNGQALHGIITDQDRTLQNEIQIIFPNTKHRWCLWHILKKLPEKFGYHVDKSSIFSAIHVLVYDSQSVEEFDEGWKSMLDTYDLSENAWLSGLYENRGRWVPCFLKTIFWLYKRALWSKVEKEFQADFKFFSQMLPCATTYEMEKQYQALYTLSKFREVQVEFTGKVYCDLMSVLEGHMGTMHEGIMCRHAIVILIRNEVSVMPDRYILRRWRRDISRAHTRVAVNYDSLVSTPTQLRYDEMCKTFASTVDLAANDEGRQCHCERFDTVEEKRSPEDKTEKREIGSERYHIKGILVRSSNAKEKRPTPRNSCIPDGVAEVSQPPEQQCSMPMLMPMLFSFSQLLLVVNLHTNKVVRILLFCDVLSRNTEFICSTFSQKESFIRREPEEPEDATKGRDVLNEKPPADELLSVSDIAKTVTTSLPDNIISGFPSCFPLLLVVQT